MAITLTINGVGYNFPQTGNDNWGSDVTNWATAVSNNLLQRTGGSFPLSSEVDFGASFGLRSVYFKSRSNNIAATGVLRLANTDSIAFRNAANSADLLLSLTGNTLQFNGSSVPISGSIVNADVSPSAAIDFSKLASLSSGNILVGNGSNVPTSVPMTGEVTISNSGVTTISPGVITNLDVNSAAAIAYTKLNLLNSITNADVVSNASIAYTKLNLVNSIVNADVASAAAIAYSKLNLATSVRASDINSQAATVGQVLTADGAGNATFAAPGTAPISSRDIENLGISTSVASNALTINLVTQAGATPSGVSPVGISFRNATLSNGTFNKRSITTARTIVVPSGATLGHRNGILRRIFVYAIDNAGTVELAVSSGVYLDNSIVSTTATPANSNFVMYSSTARTNVPCRLIGMLTSTQTTAGLWATNMSAIAVAPINIPVTAARYAVTDSQAVAQTSSIDVVWLSRIIDNFSILNTDNLTFTSPRAGTATFDVAAYMGGTTAAFSQLAVILNKNGSQYQSKQIEVNPPGVAIGPLNATTFVDNNAQPGDQYVIRVFQANQSGVSQDLVGTTTNPLTATTVNITINSDPI